MEEKIPETDQWKLNGDCSKCRRQAFCRKTCSAVKKDMNRQMRSFASAYARKIMPSSLYDKFDEWV